MNKIELLDIIRVERARLEASLGQLDEAYMSRPGVEGEWSIKDSLAHITAWEQRLVSWLRAASSGEIPAVPVPGDLDYVHRLNWQIFVENQHRPLHEVLADSHRSFQQVLTEVEAISEADLTTPLQAGWARGETRLALIAANTYEHYQEHLEPIRAWLDKSLEQLNAFIVRAKAATYVGRGARSLSYRPGSHDLQFHQGDFSYLDSYFGGADFIGEEVVYFEGKPVWAMNYYGRILEPSLITAAEAGQIIQESLSEMYQQGRFLGGFEHPSGNSAHFDTNDGDVASFTGREWITRENVKVYELVYHGGVVKE